MKYIDAKMICWKAFAILALWAAVPSANTQQKSSPPSPHAHELWGKLMQALKTDEATIYRTDGKQRFFRATITYEAVENDGCSIQYRVRRDFRSETESGRDLTPVVLDFSRVHDVELIDQTYSATDPAPEGTRYTSDAWGLRINAASVKALIYFPSRRRRDEFKRDLLPIISVCSGSSGDKHTSPW